jgi:sugar lactone lactonase YvrE
MRRLIWIAFSSALLADSLHSQTTLQLYAHHDSAAAAARRAGNWSQYGAEIPFLDSILNGHPNVRIVRARIGAHLGDTASAYASLRDFAAMGLRRRIEADTDLVALRGTPSWNALIERMTANGATIGTFSPAFVMPDSDFVAEDITYDPAGRRWLVSGIRRSVILSVARDGQQRIFIRGTDKGWGFLALGVDSARNTLWATAEAIPLAIGFDSTLSGKASVFRYNLKSGALLQRYDMPVSEKHGAGDIAVAENGDLFVADAADGTMYVIRKGGTLELLVSKGEFMSPQGPAVAPDGKHIYLADYARGIARIDRSTGRVEWLAHTREMALNSIDGLSFADSHTLIGVQNGTNPNRVIRISLDSSGLSITRVESLAQNESSIREPTHGVFAGRDYYFIANGGFGAFSDDGKLRAGERAIAPVVAKISNLR